MGRAAIPVAQRWLKIYLLLCVLAGATASSLAYAARELPVYVMEYVSVEGPLDPALFAAMFAIGAGYGALPMSLLRLYNNWPRGASPGRPSR